MMEIQPSLSDYKPIDNDSKVPVSLSMINLLEFSLTGIFQTLKMHFPMLQGMLDGFNPHINHIFQADLQGYYLKARVGKGIRATTLREIQALFPEKNIDQYIQERLPKQYSNEAFSYNDFQNYIRQTLSELKSLRYPDGEFAWFGYKDYKSMLTMLNTENFEYFHGSFSEFTSPESLKTGFYIEERNDPYSYKKSETPDILVIKLEDQVWVKKMKGESFLYLYVPLEGIWIKCPEIQNIAYEGALNELPYLDLEKIKKEYELILDLFGYQKELHDDEETLFNHFMSVINDPAIIIKNSDYETFGYFPSSPMKLPSTTLCEIKTVTVEDTEDPDKSRKTTKIYFADNRLAICIEERQFWLNGKQTQYLIEGNVSILKNNFKQVPFPAMKQYKEWMMDVLIKVSTNNVTSATVESTIYLQDSTGL